MHGSLTLCLQDPDPVHGNLWCLKVPVPRVLLNRGQREVPTDLAGLVTAHKANPVNGRVLCQTPACPAFGQVKSVQYTLLPLSPYTQCITLFSCTHFPQHLLTPSPQPVPSTLVPGPGRTLLVELVRVGAGANKVTTAVAAPQPNDPNWPNKQLVMVVAHEGSGAINTPSHWFSFFLVNGQWWKVDTAGRGSITRQDPFVSQMGARDRIGFTITFIVFK